MVEKAAIFSVSKHNTITDMNPRITVLMPVYNGEQYLRIAIDSILKQTFGDFEFLIINDGSKDRSEEIILSYDDPRIKYVKNEKNFGLIKTLNKGIDLAKGDFIARMDCDDVSFPNRFERELMEFEKDSTLDAVAGSAIDLLSENRIKRSIRYLPLSPEAFKFTSYFEISFCHPCLMIKTAVLKKLYFLDDVSALHVEDFELGQRLAVKNYKVRILSDFLIYYRKNESGVCFTHRNEQLRNVDALSAKILKSELGLGYDKNFFHILSTKKGVNSYKKLKKYCEYLDIMVDTYFSQNSAISEEAKADIESWRKVRVFSFIVSAFKEAPVSEKIRTLVMSLMRFSYIFDYGFRRSLNIYISDWLPISKKKYLHLRRVSSTNSKIKSKANNHET